MVNPHDYNREDLKTCPWFWKKDQRGSDTMVDEIQNGHSPTENDAWADLIRYKRGKTGADNVEEGTLDQFERREKALARAAAERRAKGFTAMADAKAKKEPVKEFEMKPTPDSKKGMFDGKTKAELHKMATAVKAQMKAHEDKGEAVPKALRSKHSEIDFALRAKNDWGKANESVIEEGMSLEDAQKIVGRTNSTEPYLSNMIRALSSMPALNSAEENERLAAAKIVKAAKRKGK